MGVFKYITLLFILFECISCKNRTGTPCNINDVVGVCRRIYQCPFAMNLVMKEQKLPPICQYDGDVEIACCPSAGVGYRYGEFKEYFKGSNDGVIRSKDMTCRSEGREFIICCQNKPDLPDPPEPKQCPPLPRPKLNTKVQHFAWQKCVDYQRYFNKCVSMHDHPNIYERINTCGVPTNSTTFRIHDGTPALPRQFPHMAVVGCHNAIPTDDVDVIWVGGGSLISEKYILTAAHVLVENTHGRIRYAMMGTLNKTDTKSGIIYNVIRTINHKGYEKGMNKLHDIGLLELNERKRRKRITPKEPQPCDICGKTFQTGYELKKHKRTHTGERPYMCTTCGKTYTQLGHLSIHSLSHKGIKNFNCNDCGSSFYRKADLDRHEKIHTGEKPFQCEICSKSFTQKNNLVMHFKMHIGDKPHKCEVCSKRFLTRSKMMLHSKKHDREKKKKPDYLGHI